MDHKTYCLASVLVEQLGCEKEFNGFTDSRQVIIWKFENKEVMRSENGDRTVTPLFKQLLIKKIDELF